MRRSRMQMPRHQLLGRRSNRRIIPKSRQPMHQRLFAKPRDLALGVAASRLRNRFPCGNERDCPFKVRAQLAVSDKVEWLRIWRDAAVDQPGNFIEPAALSHRMNAPLNAVVKRGARSLKADLNRGIPFQPRAARLVD